MTIDLTTEQLNTLLAAMIDRKLDNERYLSHNRVGDQPAEHESCCKYHLNRHHEDRQMYLALCDRKAHYQQLIDLLTRALHRSPAAPDTD